MKWQIPIAVVWMFALQAFASVSPASYGALGNGSTDDTQALIAACSAASQQNQALILDAATYLISSPVVANCDIAGQSPERSIILLGNPLQDGLVVTASSAVNWSGFDIKSRSQQSGGRAIYIAPIAGINQFSTFRNLALTGVWDGIVFTSGSWWRIQDCDILWYGHIGIWASDAAEPDNGDPCITGCNIVGTPYSNVTAIYQTSGGGLRISNCKIVGGAYGYCLNLTPGSVTGALVITGNSIEGVYYGIALTAGAGCFFNNCVVTGNEIGSYGIGVLAMDTHGYIWMGGLTISGNEFYTDGYNSEAINLNAVSGSSIEGNTFLSPTVPSYGIVFGPRTQFISVGYNAYNAITYPIVHK